MTNPLISSGADRRISFTSRKQEWTVILLVYLSFLLFSTVRSPVPGVNEPYYLAKAKHFWNADWCRGDFFLDSSNAHHVFYQTLGVFTQWLTLDQTAWLGRVIGVFLLSLGWTKLISRILPGRWSSVWTAWVFLAIVAIGSATRKPMLPDIEFYAFNLSGEWIIGGTEGKVFSYGFVFWSLGFIAARCWKTAAVCAGLAISFHPVVGVWGLLCGLFSAGVLLWKEPGTDPLLRRAADILKTACLPTVVLVSCAIPGLIPALQLLESRDTQAIHEAEFIHVFERLAHHLDPMTFKIGDYASYLFLILFWFSARRRIRCNKPQERFFAGFVAGTIGIAVLGLLLGFHIGPPQEMLFAELRIWLLKFYPFRPCDVFVPLAASVILVGLIRDWSENIFSQRIYPVFGQRDWLCWPIFGSLMLTALLLPSTDRNPSRMEEKQLSDWHNACRWIAQNTKEKSLYFTPSESWAFKWYASRPEFFSYKDCPQDAPGILEWQRRRQVVQQWRQTHREQGTTTLSLRQLHETTGVTHVVTKRYEPFDIKPIYWNDSYKVYRIDELISVDNE
jgi:hypothetical protein